MRIVLAFALIWLAPVSVDARDYYDLNAQLTEKGVVLGKVDTNMSVGDTVMFSRSGGYRAEFSITLKESALGGFCLDIESALEGSWGRGNSSAVCRPVEIGVPLDYSVLDEGVLHIDLRK
jgi:hypothetical protein